MNKFKLFLRDVYHEVPRTPLFMLEMTAIISVVFVVEITRKLFSTLDESAKVWLDNFWNRVDARKEKNN